MYSDKVFKKALNEILDNGVLSEHARPHYKDGTVANSKYITDYKFKYDLAKGKFPIISLRPIYIKKAIGEMLWIYQDQTSSLEILREKYGITWWDSWGLSDGTLGLRYGATVNEHDIVNRVLKQLDSNPWNRRSIINLWQYNDLDIYAKLPPCCFQIMFDVREINGELYLDAAVTQRSSDFLVSSSINQMQYVALQMMIAKHFGWKLGTFSWNVMNLHIYDRFFDQANNLINRDGQKNEVNFYLDVPDKTNFYEIKQSDFKLENYHPNKNQLKFDIAI